MKVDDILNPLPSSEKANSEFATVRVHGSIGKLAGGKKIENEKICVPLRIGELLNDLSKSLGIEIRRDSTLVLVNGIEINALSDLETVVVGGDEVSIVPMFHGGS
jgi:molybdopterin converting factor small subunit